MYSNMNYFSSIIGNESRNKSNVHLEFQKNIFLWKIVGNARKSFKICICRKRSYFTNSPILRNFFLMVDSSNNSQIRIWFLKQFDFFHSSEVYSIEIGDLKLKCKILLITMLAEAYIKFKYFCWYTARYLPNIRITKTYILIILLHTHISAY